MLRRHTLLKVNIREQFSRPYVRAPHARLPQIAHTTNHIRGSLSGDFFSSLASEGQFLQSVLSVCGVSKTYPGVIALRDVSFSRPSGAKICVSTEWEIRAENYVLFERDGHPWPDRDWEVEAETFCFYRN